MTVKPNAWTSKTVLVEGATPTTSITDTPPTTATTGAKNAARKYQTLIGTAFFLVIETIFVVFLLPYIAHRFELNYVHQLVYAFAVMACFYFFIYPRIKKPTEAITITQFERVFQFHAEKIVFLASFVIAKVLSGKK